MECAGRRAAALIPEPEDLPWGESCERPGLPAGAGGQTPTGGRTKRRAERRRCPGGLQLPAKKAMWNAFLITGL